MSRLPRGAALDRLVAVSLLVLAQVELWGWDAIRGPKALTVLLSLLVPASVALRRRWPLPVASFVFVCFAVLVAAGGSFGSFALGLSWLCAVYALAVWTRTRDFVVGFAVGICAEALSQLGPNASLGNALLWVVATGAAMLITRRLVRDRQLLNDALAGRAALLEREQELRTRDAVVAERTRIARELHDLVAHNVSVMVVQAGVERHALPAEQTSTRETLIAIEQAGRQALAEARRLLGMLRRDGEQEELEPQPTLADLHALADRIGRAGVPVRLTIEGEQVPLPAGLDLCAYRIVQESLTNTLKHAGPTQAEVLVRYSPLGLELEISDHGRGAPSNDDAGSGHGLIGMRERAALYGGRFAAGARAEGGFRVSAHLPLAR